MTDQPTLLPGDKIKIPNVSPFGKWWTVQAVSTRYTIATCQAPFKPKGERYYTIVDHEELIAGPCNLIGGGYSMDEEGWATQLLGEILSGELEITRRNRVNIRFGITRKGQPNE